MDQSLNEVPVSGVHQLFIPLHISFENNAATLAATAAWLALPSRTELIENLVSGVGG